MAIIGINQAREYNVNMDNTIQNHIRNQGMEILEENSISPTAPATEIVYRKGGETRYAYVVETGGMSDSPGQKSLISDQRMTYLEVSKAFAEAEGE